MSRDVVRGRLPNDTGVTELRDLAIGMTQPAQDLVRVLAERRDRDAFAALEVNLAEAREAAQRDLIRYADLTAEFSMLITRHCGNRTLALFAALIHDIIRRQHEHVTARTLADAKVDRLRQRGIANRERALDLMRHGTPEEAERFWRAHLVQMRDLVLAVYPGSMTIDVLADPTGRLRPIGKVRRAGRTTAQAA